MKSYKIILALGISALTLASCADKAYINGVLAGSPDKDIVIKKLDGSTLNVLDTVKTRQDGAFSYALAVEKGKPEFVYVYYGQTNVASLLLETGEKAVVKTDTLGNCEVSGSEGSAKLAEIRAAQAAFSAKVNAATDISEVSKAYVEHYREAIKFVMSNPKSLSVIPVLYESVVEGLPLFNNATDAIVFRSAADSLKTVYPDSPIVAALDKEAARRESNLELSNRIKSAEQLGYPDLNLPDINGKKVALSSLKDKKVILLHFWSSQVPAQSIFNNDTLLPIYKEYSGRGLEIYSVCLDADKSQWGGVVKAQNLPWINVNDGLGSNSPSVMLYNLKSLPASFIITNDSLKSVGNIKGVDGLRKELDKLIRQ